MRMRPRTLASSMAGILCLGLATGHCMTKSGDRATTYQAPVDVEKPHPNDKRQYRALKLDNGMEVLLMSDPGLKKSAASLDVNVGNMEDPDENAGMAHFLEHMLFLGTKKYPDPGEYGAYLQKNQGYSNAFTGSEHTNYHFEVNHDAFEGGLDRFAQFFVDPLFTAEFVDREMNAVHSEHQKNLKDDNWRMYRLMTSTYKEGHPRRKFGTGNLSTLKTASRDRLIAFYNKYYSSDVMKLALLSNASLDDQEKWVRAKFATVKNTNRKPLVYDQDIFEDKDLPQILSMKPVKELKELNLVFEMPSEYGYWKSKPARILSSLVGYEGQGSLLSWLQKEGLATKLGASQDSESFAGTFNISIDLTDKGVKEYDRVIEAFFAYMDMIKKEGYRPYYYAEKRAMADVGFVYRDFEEGTNVVVRYANTMHYYPAQEVDRRLRLLTAYSEDDFNVFLKNVTPGKMKVLAAWNGVKTDKVDEHYGTEYSVAKASADQIARWTKPQTIAALSYPASNPYIPRNLEIIKDAALTKPVAIVDDQRGKVWFEQDHKFNLPRASVNIDIMSKVAAASPKNRLMTLLYVRTLNESLREWRYPIMEAGLGFGVADINEGLSVKFNGYAEHMPSLMAELGQKMKNLDISEAAFNDVKAEYIREAANWPFNPAYQQALYEARYLVDSLEIHKESYKDFAAKVTLADVKAFGNELLATTGMRGAVYGNLDAKKLTDAVNQLYAALGSKPLDRKQWPIAKTVPMKDKSFFGYVKSVKNNNNAMIAYNLAGARSPQLEGILRVGESQVGNEFFEDLRTKQQLGYIVASRFTNRRDTSGMLFLVQSENYNSGEVAKRVKKWMDLKSKDVSKTSNKQFNELKQSIITELSQPPKTIDESEDELYNDAVFLDEQFGYRQKVVAALQALTKDEYVKNFSKFLKGQMGSGVAVYMIKDGEKPVKPLEKAIANPVTFKGQQKG